MIDKIPDFRFPYNQPTVYDEQQPTVLELVGQTAYKMNELIDQFNGINETIANAETSEINAKTSENNAKVSENNLLSLKNEIIDARSTFTSLKDKLNNNDTQINNKADILALESETNSRQSNDINLQNQINNLVVGSGTSSAEVVQNRVDLSGLNYTTVKSKSDNIERLITTGKKTIEFYDLVNKAVSDVGVVGLDSSLRVTTTNLYPVEVNSKISVVVPNNYDVFFFGFDNSQTFQLVRDYKTNIEFTALYPFYRIKVQKVDNANITPQEVIDNIIIQITPSNYISNELKDAHTDELNNTYDNIGDYLRTISTELRTMVGLGKNMFNSKDPDVVVGYINTANNTIVNTATYKTSGYIAVTQGTIYVLSPRVRKLLEYDANKTPVYATALADTTSNYVYTASVNGYIRFSYYLTDENTMMMEVGDTPTDFKPYGKELKGTIVLNDTQIEEIAKSMSNLYGKKLFTFGDSIMAGDGNGGVGIGDLLATKYLMTLTDYSAGGSTIGYDSTRTNLQLVYKQIETAISAGIQPNIILFNGLTNDINNVDNGSEARVPLGNISSGYNRVIDVNTFSGAFEQICYDLTYNFVNSIIIYVRPHNMSSRNAQRQIDYGERAISICKKYGIPYIDLYSIFNTNILTQQTAFLTDTTHPNNTGYTQKYLPLIEAKMKELIF